MQNPFGDRGGDGGDAGYALSTPLRLSLMGSVIPKASGFPNCATREDDVGNSVGGIPVQHYVEWRLTPRLVLSAFTQLGCPIDGGIGTALTYAVPLRLIIAARLRRRRLCSSSADRALRRSAGVGSPVLGKSQGLGGPEATHRFAGQRGSES